MKKKQIINEYYYDEIIKYLEKSFNKYQFDGSIRDSYIREFLIKYIRIIKSVRLLDLNGFHHECDIMIRSLDEMIIDLAYLELNPSINYERYDLFVHYQEYDLIKERSDIEHFDINTYPDIKTIKEKHDNYEKKYSGKRSRWSGVSYYEQAQKVDESGKTSALSLTDMFINIYRLNCLNSHNSGIVLDKIYKYVAVSQDINYMYLHNINYVVLLTVLLKDICLPHIFNEETKIFKEFDTFLGGLDLIILLNQY